MARIAKPWWREDRQSWWVIIRSERHNLGPDKETADREFHRLLSLAPVKPVAKPQVSGLSVADVLEKHLAWCEKHRAPRTYDWYRDFAQSFLDSLKRPDQIPATELKPFHVIEWVDAHPDWGDTYRRSAIIAIQRPYNWAEELKYIPDSPIKKIKKPTPKRRDNAVTPADFEEIRSRYREGDPFLDLLDFCWNSGCRPQEATLIESRHVKGNQIEIPPEEAKGKKRWRIIHLNAAAQAIIQRLVSKYPKGKLFRNEDGKPWKRFAVCNRFDRLHLAHGIQKLKELGITPEPLPRFNRRHYDKQQLKAARSAHKVLVKQRQKAIRKLAREHGVGFSCYDLRHGFATRLLVKGVDHVTVGTLMGHKDGTQVARTYQHLNKQETYLKSVLEANA
jgi:integrase